MNPIPLPSWFLRRRDSEDCRRQTTRMACDHPVCNLGEILDLSATGARIACRRFFRPVEGKPTTLAITTHRGETLNIPCVVCWARKSDVGWEAGLAFSTLTDRDARILGEHAMRASIGMNRARSA